MNEGTGVTNLQEALAALARRYHLVAIYAFGCRAEEVTARVAGAEAEATPSPSDVDIGVLPAARHRISPRDKVALTLTLEEAFGATRVDLVILPEAPLT